MLSACPEASHAMMRATALYLILFCLGTAIAGDHHEAQYIIRPSDQLKEYCCVDRCRNDTESVDGSLTLSQFIDNSSDYLTNDTTLIFSPGNYSLESPLIVQDVHSFSMFAWPSVSSKVIIACDSNASFEFSNVSIVTVSGLEFVGCFENCVLSVGQFQLENSVFYGNGQRRVNGTVLTIEESTANLDKVAFMSIVRPCKLPKYCNTAICTHRVSMVLLKRSSIRIAQSWFEGNDVCNGEVIYEIDSNMTVTNSTFANNNNNTDNVYNYCRVYCKVETYWRRRGSTVKILNNKLAKNVGVVVISHSTFTNNAGYVLNAIHTNISISHSVFVSNAADHSMGISNVMLYDMSAINITHNEFIANQGYAVIHIYGGNVISMSLNKFINNKAIRTIVIHYTTIETLANNIFINNDALMEVFIMSNCRPGLSLSLGSRRCIPCSEHWRRDLIGIMVGALIAGIALVIFMLALNMTVAIGTLNGILFYANIVAANAETFFLPFKTPSFVTMLISWLNLDINFDVCFETESSKQTFFSSIVYKTLMQLTFPTYVTILVIVVIVASECSSKFAKIAGKGNPVAVLATMVWISCAKFSHTIILLTFSLVYEQPRYGSHNYDATKFGYLLKIFERKSSGEKAISSFLGIFASLISILCIIFTTLVFSWQWLLQYQEKAIFKWVRYQKLHLFLEPYHTPYTAKYRYWTGLLLFVRVLLYLISVLNFSLDPRVDLMATIFIIGCLILLKGVTAKRIYKNWPLDVMETAIYFNLVAFSALTWYNLDFGGNQVAVAYMSVMIIFILLLGVIVFHALRYTRLYKCTFVEKAFKWISSKLLEKEKPKQEVLDDAPEELDGVQLERAALITYSFIDIPKQDENQAAAEPLAVEIPERDENQEKETAY